MLQTAVEYYDSVGQSNMMALYVKKIHVFMQKPQMQPILAKKKERGAKKELHEAVPD